MKPDFRRNMIWLHTYSGLLIGWLLFAIFVTGTLSYFTPEISQWMKPELGSQTTSNKLINKSLQMLKQKSDKSERWQINLPTQRSNQFTLSWWIKENNKTKRNVVTLNSQTFNEIHVRDTHGGNFFRTFHYTLELRQYGGRYFAGIAAMVMLIGIFTGIFTHRRFFQDFFTIRVKKLMKTVTDLHAIVGVITLPFCFVISFSALLIYISLYMPWSAEHHFDNGYRELNSKVTTSLPKLISANKTVEPLIDLEPILAKVEKAWPEHSAITHLIYERPFDLNGRIVIYRQAKMSLSNKSEILAFNAKSGELLEAIAPERTARMIRRIFYGLHEAHFAQPVLRWLLFFMGVASCILIGSGLIIWLKKRLDKLKQRHFGHTLVERLNIAGICGLILAVVSYFYANRLIPINLESRAVLEVNVFLFVWFASFIYSFLRPALKAWLELLFLNGIAFLMLPILDLVINPHWLIQAIEYKNMAYIGFNLALIISGGICLMFYYWLRKTDLKTHIKINNTNHEEQILC
ncbi:PepSY-associated TM helix domain-containing protein [Pseudoalteromonas denitrificans]|uniref:Uncharacterized iron-regulated membrane protein n=1 Tax=Pseudoalteromonas denitrificans DSM 6059 TaxID=1123010 RepID=A0A1I1IAP5_9GAMM|nr:PepSY-associated TM helix domain-containing protein [Pseudoalteromonas denitrificans]SFC32872.1 Uncharacterized iron-regulated membrane protein [Pseudoalteromonas denitrificans DSM 6059]